MKKIFSILLAVLALLSVVTIALADGESSTTQIGPDYIDEHTGICYNKTVEATTDGSGIYWITLESFAKGGGVKVMRSIASDIVLVLDVSGSMGYNFGTKITYTGTTKGWTYNNSGTTTWYFLHTDKEYYRVTEDRNNSGVLAYYTVGSKYYYLTSSGVVEQEPSRVGRSTVYYNGTLYQQSSHNQTRLEALQEAVCNFIDLIDEDDRKNPPIGQTRIGHKIAIVTYSEQGTIVEELQALDDVDALKATVNGLTADGGTMANRGMQKAKDILTSEASTNSVKTTVFFTDGNPGVGGTWDNNDQNWNTSMDQYSSYQVENETRFYENTWIVANKTISLANDIKNLADDSVTPEIISNVFTVSIIQNPGDYTKVFLGKTSSNWKDATSMGSITITQGAGYNNYIVSGWNSDDIWSNGNSEAVRGDKQIYAIQADDADQLNSAFATVAGESGGSTLEITEDSIAEVDVVSASFKLPKNVNASDLQFFVAKCNGRHTITYIDEETNTEKQGTFYTFDPEVSKANCVYTYDKPVLDEDGNETGETVVTNVLANVTPEFKASGTYPGDSSKKDVVEVTGFDYGRLYVGPILKPGVTLDDPETATDDQIDGWHGYKLIVKIPILMDDNAVGGPGVDTNGDGSGIIVDGNPVVTFKSPKMDLPINLFINKQGLNVGESAKFTIYRIVKPDSWSAEGFDYPEDSSDPRYDQLGSWEEVSSVFVTQHEGDAVDAAITKVVGLPSVDTSKKEYIYRIVEDDWSWSYSRIVDVNDPETLIYTSDQLITNPFKFKNSKTNMIDVTVRHAESKATNTFHNGNFVVDDETYKTVPATHVSYDDSKDNGR